MQRGAETAQDPSHGARAREYDPFVIARQEIAWQCGSHARRAQAVAAREVTDFHDVCAQHLPAEAAGQHALDRRFEIVLQIQGLVLRPP